MINTKIILVLNILLTHLFKVESVLKF